MTHLPQTAQFFDAADGPLGGALCALPEAPLAMPEQNLRPARPLLPALVMRPVRRMRLLLLSGLRHRARRGMARS